MTIPEAYATSIQKADTKYQTSLPENRIRSQTRELPFDVNDSRVLTLIEEYGDQKPVRYFFHLDPIDIGGSGSIHYGWDAKMNRRVIVKAIDDIEEINFSPGTQEAAIHGKQDHPNIVKIFDATQRYNPMRQKNTTYLILEDLIEKHFTPLTNYLKRHKDGVRVSEIIHIMEQITEGLSYLKKSKTPTDNYIKHDGSIHQRDVKPENIMISPDGQVKILDFSIATHVPLPQKEESFLGTLGYMAPEVILGNIGDYNEQSDVYACGLLIYELLTGRPLFPINKSESIDMQIYIYINDLINFTPTFHDASSTKPEAVAVREKCRTAGLDPMRVGSFLTHSLAPNREHRFHSLEAYVNELYLSFIPSSVSS